MIVPQTNLFTFLEDAKPATAFSVFRQFEDVDLRRHADWRSRFWLNGRNPLTSPELPSSSELAEECRNRIAASDHFSFYWFPGTDFEGENWTITFYFTHAARVVFSYDRDLGPGLALPTVRELVAAQSIDAAELDRQSLGNAFALYFHHKTMSNSALRRWSQQKSAQSKTLYTELRDLLMASGLPGDVLSSATAVPGKAEIAALLSAWDTRVSQSIGKAALEQLLERYALSRRVWLGVS